MNKDFSILIVEDEVFIAQDLKETLEEVGYKNVFKARNYTQAVEILNSKNIDFAMLDINLNDSMTGIDVGNYILKNLNIPFVYLTSYSDSETIAKVKHTKPSAYLLKPFNRDHLLASLDIALLNFYSSKNMVDESENELEKHTSDIELIINGNLVIKDKKYFIKIPLEDIFWMESDKNYIDVITAERKYTIRGSLKKLSEELPASFIKCHRQYIINLNYVTGFSSNLILLGDVKIPVSRNEQELILKKLKD